jgi:hypothetical protein
LNTKQTKNKTGKEKKISKRKRKKGKRYSPPSMENRGAIIREPNTGLNHLAISDAVAYDCGGRHISLSVEVKG